VSEKAETAYQTAHDEQDLSAQQRAASSALITAVLSFLALVLSGFGVWFVKKTLDATIAAVEDTGKATRAMERQNRLAEDGQRPWLSIELTFESADFSDDLFHIKGFVSIKNIGSMVARQFYPRLNCRFRGIDFSDDILALHREWTDRIPVVSDVLLPGEELRLSCNIVERPEYIRWYEDGDKRRAFAVVIACAHYQLEGRDESLYTFRPFLFVSEDPFFGVIDIEATTRGEITMIPVRTGGSFTK